MEAIEYERIYSREELISIRQTYEEEIDTMEKERIQKISEYTRMKNRLNIDYIYGKALEIEKKEEELMNHAREWLDKMIELSNVNQAIDNK